MHGLMHGLMHAWFNGAMQCNAWFGLTTQKRPICKLPKAEHEITITDLFDATMRLLKYLLQRCCLQHTDICRNHHSSLLLSPGG